MQQSDTSEEGGSCAEHVKEWQTEPLSEQKKNTPVKTNPAGIACPSRCPLSASDH